MGYAYFPLINEIFTCKNNNNNNNHNKSYTIRTSVDPIKVKTTK